MKKFANTIVPALIPVLIAGALFVMRTSPKPPPGADFLYSVGWYSSHAFAAVGNLFR